jgi:hypothetical protein
MTHGVDCNEPLTFLPPPLLAQQTLHNKPSIAFAPFTHALSVQRQMAVRTLRQIRIYFAGYTSPK